MRKFLCVLMPVLLAAGLWLTGCAGAGGTPVNVVSREGGSGTRGAFIELFGVQVKADGTTQDMTTQEANIVNKTDVMLTTVAGDKNSIGYVSLGSLNNTVKALAINGVAATVENVKNGSYEIKRPFNIAVKKDAEGLTAEFINYILSSDGQAIVAKDCVAVDANAAPYTGDKPEGRLVIAGSSSVAPLMEKLAEAYKQVNPNAAIEIQTSDSTAGMTAAIEGTCDIGMASRELKDSEKETLTEIAIAIDGIAVIVSPDNPCGALTQEQVRRIYIGEITDWRDINS